MSKPARVLVALTALLHLYIAWFEMFAWTTVGRDTFESLDPELFPQTTDLAANQGMYNLFLAIGLIWALFIKDNEWQVRVATCFLVFVALAGLTAAVTVSVRTGMPQMVPSLLGLLAIWLPRLTSSS